jgi:hypothetical protein
MDKQIQLLLLKNDVYLSKIDQYQEWKGKFEERADRKKNPDKVPQYKEKIKLYSYFIRCEQQKLAQEKDVRRDTVAGIFVLKRN